MRLSLVWLVFFVVVDLVPSSPLNVNVGDRKYYRGVPITATTSTSTITPHFLQQFCTLENFQKCIGEIWPNPVGQAEGKSKAKEATAADDDDDDDDETESSTMSTTTSGGGGGGGGGGARRKSSGTDFPTSLSELQATCQDLKERVRCLDRHSELCFTNAMLQVFGHIVSNAKQFVHDLCYNKKIQKEFLVHARCFRNISLDEQKCGQEYRDALDFPMNKDQQKQQQQQQQQQEVAFMRQSCCALQELVLCKRRHVREQCGQAAAIFMRDHLPRITNPVLEQHCSAYTYGPGTCNEALYRRRYGGAAHPLGVLAADGQGLRPAADDNGMITTSGAEAAAATATTSTMTLVNTLSLVVWLCVTIVLT